MKAYREALNSPDDSFFKDYWPHVKRAVEYLIHRDAATSGGTPDGTLEDGQDNTYDQQLHGITTFMSGYYLAALRAGEEWARRMGDVQTANASTRSSLKAKTSWSSTAGTASTSPNICPITTTRSMEAARVGAAIGEIGPGCMADQLIGQWWAHQLGLGYILPKDKVQAAMRAIFKYNWVFDLTGFKHMPRAFAGDKDKGLLIVTWPKGGRPAGSCSTPTRFGPASSTKWPPT